MARLLSGASRFAEAVVAGVSRAGRIRLAVVAAAVGVLVFAFAAAADERKAGTREELSSGSVTLPPGVTYEDLPRAGERGAEGLLESLRQENALADERERKLASVESRELRERFRTEHVGASDAAASLLAEQTFGELLGGEGAGLGFADVAGGRTVRRFVDDYTVVLEGNAEQPPVLVESPWPVRAVADDGRKRAVDLSLEPTDGGLKPVNAASDLMIPTNLADGIEVGEIRVAPGGSADGELSSAEDDRVI